MSLSDPARRASSRPVDQAVATRRIRLASSELAICCQTSCLSGGGALITGHTVHTGGGAFDSLETLTRCDTVRVRTRRGTVEYVVTHVRIYRKSSLARHAGEVFSQQVPGRLVLITCEGWNGAGYDSNAVVLARPI